jgi:hypothetical protein
LEPPSSPPRLEVEEEEGNGGLEEEEGRSSRSGKLVSPLITITLSTLWMKQEMKTLQVNKHLGKLIVKKIRSRNTIAANFMQGFRIHKLKAFTKPMQNKPTPGKIRRWPLLFHPRALISAMWARSTDQTE